jgi:hypothetical protein
MCLNCFCWKALTPPNLGHEWTKSRRKAWHLCLHFVPVVLCSKPFFPTLESRKKRNDQYLYDKGLKLPLRKQWRLAGQPTSPNEDNYLSWWGWARSRSNQSWEPACSPQVKTAITTSPESSKNKDWDTGQPGPTRSLEHTRDWDCLAMHTFCPLP